MQEKTVHAILQDSPTVLSWDLTDPAQDDLVLGSFKTFRELGDFVRQWARKRRCTYRIMTLKA